MRSETASAGLVRVILGVVMASVAHAAGCADQGRAASAAISPISDERVRHAASEWMAREQGVTIDDRVTWGPTSRDDEGTIRVVAWVGGNLADGSVGVRRYVMDLAPSGRGPEGEAMVVRAWGPREVGGGCTCHYFGEARLK